MLLIQGLFQDLEETARYVVEETTQAHPLIICAIHVPTMDARNVGLLAIILSALNAVERSTIQRTIAAANMELRQTKFATAINKTTIQKSMNSGRNANSVHIATELSEIVKILSAQQECMMSVKMNAAKNAMSHVIHALVPLVANVYSATMRGSGSP